MKTKFSIFIIFIIPMFAFQAENHEPAVNFLNSLTRAQKNKAQMQFDDDSKHDWHYFPASMYPRAGISIGELNEATKTNIISIATYFP